MDNIEKTPAEFNSEVCLLKHQNVDDKIDDTKREINYRCGEIAEAFKEFKQDNKNETDKKLENLKNKVIVSVQSIYKKIDGLTDIQKELKKEIEGNGDIGILEEIRNMKSQIKRNSCILGAIVVLMLGGKYWGLSLEVIREKIFGITPVVKIEDKENSPKEKTAQPKQDNTVLSDKYTIP